MDMAIAAEAAGEVLNASVFGGFPQADIPHLGLSAVIVHDARRAGGEAPARCATACWRMAWERREDFLYHGEPLADSDRPRAPDRPRARWSSSTTATTRPPAAPRT